MKATLVNHSGIIQRKFILRNADDVLDYHKINVKQHTEHVLDFSGQPNSIREAITEIAKMTNESMIITGFKMADEKIMTIDKAVREGKVVVVNMSGGWTFWDDSTMSVVKSETGKDIVGSEYFPKVNIINSEVLVLENQEKIPEYIPLFIKTVLKTESFSSVVSLDYDYNNEIESWIQQAIKNGCNTIVAETQLVDKNQILKMIALFEKLPSFTFHIFTGSNLKEILSSLVDEQIVDSLFKKHTIIIH